MNTACTLPGCETGGGVLPIVLPPVASFPRAPVFRARVTGRIKRLSSSAGPSGSSENVSDDFADVSKFLPVAARTRFVAVVRVPRVSPFVHRANHARQRAWKICTCPTEEVSRATQDVLSIA